MTILKMDVITVSGRLITVILIKKMMILGSLLLVIMMITVIMTMMILQLDEMMVGGSYRQEHSTRSKGSSQRSHTCHTTIPYHILATPWYHARRHHRSKYPRSCLCSVGNIRVGVCVSSKMFKSVQASNLIRECCWSKIFQSFIFYDCQTLMLVFLE